MTTEHRKDPVLSETPAIGESAPKGTLERNSLSVKEAEKIAKWELQRRGGRWAYVWKVGMLRWGLSMFVVSFIYTASTSQSSLLKSLLINIAIWPVISAGYGTLMWYAQEYEYKKKVC